MTDRVRFAPAVFGWLEGLSDFDFGWAAARIDDLIARGGAPDGLGSWWVVTDGECEDAPLASLHLDADDREWALSYYVAGVVVVFLTHAEWTFIHGHSHAWLIGTCKAWERASADGDHPDNV